MQNEIHPWHAVLDDLIGYAQYHQEIGDRVIPGSATLLATLAAPPPQKAKPAAFVATPLPLPQAENSPAVPSVSCASKIEALHAAINACQLCALCKTRKHAVPGNGNTQSPDILFIDESPALEDDATGVAAAPDAHHGLLRKMIGAMGYAPEEVFITSLCKCVSPNAQRPAQESLDACRQYVETQIALLKPKVIVLLGAGATMGLLKKSASPAIAKTRGAWTQYNGIPVMPTYAPGYIDKFPAVKPQVWKDLQIVMKRLGKPVPAKKQS